uniref:Uncharacterized protein n=1 Tax=Romanomermis culicivorax TaxID=13658 RepID=A0A915KZK1_ROMCU
MVDGSSNLHHLVASRGQTGHLTDYSQQLLQGTNVIASTELQKKKCVWKCLPVRIVKSPVDWMGQMNKKLDSDFKRRNEKIDERSVQDVAPTVIFDAMQQDLDKSMWLPNFEKMKAALKEQAMAGIVEPLANQ